MFRICSILAVIVALWLWPGVSKASDAFKLEYRLDFTQAPSPAKVSLKVHQLDGQLRRLRFSATSDQFLEYSSPTGLERNEDEYTWHVPAEGGTLTWRAPITHHRKGGGVDAKLGKLWALFRGEDAFPPMASVGLKGSSSTSELFVDMPSSWSFYSAFEKTDSGYAVANAKRLFDRPTGWMIAGAIGVRFDQIAGVKISVAAPTGHTVRRQDMMALLNWTLADMTSVLGSFPSRILIVSAAEDFWRGGLSGPSSLYIHADRPLISGNGTSTLIHELFHVGFARTAADGNDWIIEGLAEYYSVELLRRTKTVTESRNRKTLKSLAKWGKESKSLTHGSSSGPTTARAVGIFQRLDKDIQQRTDNKKRLDDVVRRLALNSGPLDIEELRSVVTTETGIEPEYLSGIK